jgi:hypothetical protein
MDETAYTVPRSDDATDVLFATLERELIQPSARNQNRFSGMKLALGVSLGLWAVIGYGVWVAVHAMS